MALNQIGTHLVGEKGMFIICTVMDARCQHSDDGVALARRRCHAVKRLTQIFRIVADVADADSAEQFGKHVHHRFAVFKHVGNARRGTGIILKHEKFVRAGAHQIDADDMRVNAPRRQKADHLAQESGVVLQKADRQPSGADDFLTVVNILQERVDCANALFDTTRDLGPFARRHDARDDVEWDQPFFGLVIAVNRKGDARAPEELFGLTRFTAQLLDVLIAEPFMISGISGACRTVLCQHFIEAGRFGEH